MKKLYWIDGTPLDILRHKAKRLKKKNDDLALSEAQDRIAQEHGAKSWADLHQGCWWPEEDTQHTWTEGGFLTRHDGPDQINIDFGKLDELLAIYDDEPFAISLHSELDYMEPGRVEFRHSIREDDNKGSYGEYARILNSQDVYDLDLALKHHYQDPPQHGMIVLLLAQWGLLTSPCLKEFDIGDMEALLTLELRGKKEVLGDRYLLNCAKTDVRTGHPPKNRCFLFKLTGERVLVTNGAKYPPDLLYKIVGAEDWTRLETELRHVFPDGPEQTFDSETWLFDKVLMVDPMRLRLKSATA